MTSKRLYFILLGTLGISIVLIIVGAYGANSTLEKRANNLLGLKAQQTALTNEQTQLAEMKKDITKYTNLYQIAQAIVPQSKDQTETVRQIVNLASVNNITLSSITFPASSLGTGTSSLNLGTSSTPTEPTSALEDTSPTLSQLTPIKNIPGVYALQIELASSTTLGTLATYPELIGFLSALEQNRLTAQVSSIDIEPDQTARSQLSFTLDLNIFIKPGTSK